MSDYPQGVHFVGSVSLDNTEEVLTTISSTLPNHVFRLPDGETADRNNWVVWQVKTFQHVPRLQRSMDSGLEAESEPSVPESEIAKMLGTLHTGYDVVALESYQKFRSLKAQGVIAPHVKFQVSVPTPVAAVSRAIQLHYAAAVEPHWKAALIRDLRKIQDQIPHDELAIQIDVAAEVFFLEGVYKENNQMLSHMGAIGPWFDNVRDGAIDRLLDLAGNGHIDADVDLGFHLCYGDLGRRHFKEPTDLKLLTELSQALLTRLDRRIDWIHMPVPKDRHDMEYLQPLNGMVDLLAQQRTYLFLGLVHADDVQGTKTRVQVAQQVLGPEVAWGVATECGLGRAPRHELASIFDISRSVSKAVVEAGS